MSSGLPIAVPLLVGTADAQRQHVLGVFQFPPGAGPLETVLDDVTVRTFDFARPDWQLGDERVSIVELPRAIGEIAMRRAHRSVVIGNGVVLDESVQFVDDVLETVLFQPIFLRF